VSDRIAKLVEQFRAAPLFKFSEWPAPGARSADRAALQAVPTEPGVYSIWNLETNELVYAGRAMDGDEGLRGRLKAHARGRRSGDQFSIYVCDKFVLPTLDLGLHDARLSKNRTYLDDETHVYIRRNLGYRFVATESAKAAAELEVIIRSGALGVRPLLNPTDD